jgi:hypothetical protein
MDRFKNAWLLLNNNQAIAPQSAMAEPYIEAPTLQSTVDRPYWGAATMQATPEEVMVSPSRPAQGISPSKQFNEMVSQSKGNPQSMRIKESTKYHDFDPTIMKQIASTGEELKALRAKDDAMQTEAIKDYEDQIAQYENAPRQIDWRPLAALLDSWTPGKSNLLQAAQSMAPESIDAQKKNIMAMKKSLADMKGSANKNQIALLKEQLDSYLGILREVQKEKSEERKMQNELERTERLFQRDIEKDVQKLSQEVQGKAALDESVAELENLLGFSIDDIDKLTGNVKGKEVDMPGVVWPGFGRISFYSKDARMIDGAMARIFNTELKDRSGAAVTNQELERLKQEFAAGRFQTEAEKLAATKRYTDLLQKELNRRESAFRPIVRSTYKERIADRGNKISNAERANPIEKPSSSEKPSSLSESARAELARRRATKGQ